MSSPSTAQQLLTKLDSKQGRQIVMLLTAAVLGFLGFKQLKPAYDSAAQVRVETQQVQAQTQASQRTYNSILPQLKTSKGSDLSTTIANALPAKVDGDQQLELLTRLADSTGVKIPSFQPSAPAPGSNYQKLPVSLSVKCSFVNCLRFLGGLRGMVSVKGDQVKAYGPIWYVDQISLGTAVKGDMTMTVTGGLYQAAAAAPTTGAAGSSAPTNPTTPGATP